MKKSLLLSGAALCAISAMAQDYAPEAWRFSEMPEGEYGYFIREMASTNWNCKAPFRLADNGRGGVGLAECYGNGSNLVGPQVDNYEGMSEEDKAYFEEFYKACTIVKTNLINTNTQESTPENIFCFIGVDAADGYAGVTPCTQPFGAATLFWLSGNENSTNPMPVGANYRFTIDYRVIPADKELADGKIDLTFATSAYDGVDNNTGLASGGYRSATLPIYGAFSDYWNRAIVDFIVEDNNDPEYKELPIAIKMWWGKLATNSVILMRSMKLEKIDEINMDNVPCNLNEYPDYSDQPGAASVEQLDIKDDALISAANGVISVVDADAAIEVYNMAGVKVAAVAAPSTVENIDIDMNGVFIVKVGNNVKKVIL